MVKLALARNIIAGICPRILVPYTFHMNYLDQPGVRRVAVKMVRFDHLGSLSDLVSEYSMMKEVDHENVIKLLGACTDKKGPFYIILEYAEHGSMRYCSINVINSQYSITSKELSTKSKGWEYGGQIGTDPEVKINPRIN